MFRFSLLIFLLLFTISQGHALSLNHDSFTLRASFGPGYSDIKSASGHDHSPGLGFQSAVGYLWKDFELGFQAMAFLSSYNEVRMTVRGTSIDGSMKYRSVAIGPLVKYYTPWRPFKDKDLAFHVGLGVFTSQATLKPRIANISTNGNYTPNHKVTAEGFGGMVAVGFSNHYASPKGPNRLTETLSDHYFVELSYKLIAPNRVSEVGGTRSKAETIGVDSPGERFVEQSLMLALGARFF